MFLCDCVIRGGRRIGRTLSASSPCSLSTPPSVSSRRTMPATPLPRSWPVLRPKPRSSFATYYSMLLQFQYALLASLDCCEQWAHSKVWILHNLQILRDGRWTEEDAAILVPGDVISIKLGDIIPADARLLEGDPLKIDQVLPLPLCSWLANTITAFEASPHSIISLVL